MLIVSGVAFGLASVFDFAFKQNRNLSLTSTRDSLASLFFRVSSNGDALIAAQTILPANKVYADCTSGAGTTSCSATTLTDFQLTDTNKNVIAGSSANLTSLGVDQANNVYYDANGARCHNPGTGTCLLQATSQFSVDCGAGNSTCLSKDVKAVMVTTTIGMIKLKATGTPILPTGVGLIKDVASKGPPVQIPLSSGAGGLAGGSTNTLPIWASPTTLSSANITENSSTLTISDSAVKAKGTVTADKDITSTSGNLTAGGGKVFLGTDSLSGGGRITTSGDFTVSGTARVNGAEGLQGTLWVGGITTVNNQLWVTGSNANFYVGGQTTSTGDLWVGYKTPGSLSSKANFHLNGSAGVLGDLWVGSSGQFHVDSNGNQVSTSDERLKTNIQPIPDDEALRFLRSSRPVNFQWKTGDHKYNFGFIAQDLAKTGFDEVLSLTPDKSMKAKRDPDGFSSPAGLRYGAAYMQLIPLLTQAMKAIDARVSTLFHAQNDQSAKIAELARENESLKARVKKDEETNRMMRDYLCRTSPSAPFCKN